MANGNPKKGGAGGRDMVMESRHLLGVFLGVVVLCGVFFTLGYVMGRTQYDTSVRAAVNANRDKVPTAPAVTPTPNPQPQIPVPAPSEWTFPSAAESKKPADALKPSVPQPSNAAPGSTLAANKPDASPAASKPAASLASKRALWKAPPIPRGAIVLQVAALTREGDALALAEALQKKEYPAFVLTPTTGNLYRVQVGPYADAQSADLAKRALEREGFKAITKR